MLYIGNHTSSSRGYLAMGKQMLANGGNTFAFFTRNPRGGKAKDIDPQDVQAFGQLAEENHFGKLVAHAPYTMNCCAAKENLRDFAREIMADDLRRLEMTPGNYYNFHPGSHVGQGAEVGISKIAEILNEVLTKDQSTIVLLETMSGKGTEVGRNFEELRQIIDRVELKDKLGVCLDTCHVYDAGYDLVGQLEALAHRDICRQQHLLREQGHLVVDEILCRALADGQHQHLALFGPGLLEHVGIVSTGKAAVACNDDEQGALHFVTAQVGVAGAGVGRGDFGQSLMQRFKVRAAVLHPFLGAAHFGGSHQFHCLGDLHGALYAFDAQLDVLHGTSHALRLLP